PHGVDQRRRLRRLEQEPGGARAQRTEHVLVEVERGEHEHLGQALLDDLPRRRHAVRPGHAHVHEHDVGPQRPCVRHGHRAVTGLAHDLDVAGGGEQHAQAGADGRVVVREQHPDHEALPSAARAVAASAASGRGSSARTTQPSAPWRPAVNVPPTAVTRSRIDTRPRPVPPTAPPAVPGRAGGAASRAPLSRTSTSTASPTATESAARGPPCLSTLVSASRTTRYTAWSTAAGSTVPPDSTPSGSATVRS